MGSKSMMSSLFQVVGNIIMVDVRAHSSLSKYYLHTLSKSVLSILSMHRIIVEHSSQQLLVL